MTADAIFLAPFASDFGTVEMLRVHGGQAIHPSK